MFGSLVIAGNKKVYAEAIAKLMIFQVFFFFLDFNNSNTRPASGSLVQSWPQVTVVVGFQKHARWIGYTIPLCVHDALRWIGVSNQGVLSPVFMGICSRSTVLLTRIKQLINTDVFSYTVIFLLPDGCVFVFTFPAFKSTEKQTSELANKERSERFFNGKTAFV